MLKKILFITFLLITSLGFSQEKSFTQLAASPNPFIKETTISFYSTKKQVLFFSVKSILGKTAFKRAYIVKKGTNKIPFSRKNLHKGMYIYTLRNQKESISKRFVIQ